MEIETRAHRGPDEAAESGYARRMQTRLSFALLSASLGLSMACGGLLAACGGASSAPAAGVEEASTGGEVEDVALPLEAYLSPSLDYLAVDVATLRNHALVAELFEGFVASLESSSRPDERDLAAAARRTSRALLVGNVEHVPGGAWIFARGEFADFQPESTDPNLSMQGDHTLILSSSGAPAGIVGDPRERLDDTIVARVTIGDLTREELSNLPVRATVESAEQVRLRVGLRDVISIQLSIVHVDDAAADRSLRELSNLLARVRPLLLVAPQPLRRLAETLALAREGSAVVARLDVSEADARELAALAMSAGAQAFAAQGR